MENQAKEIEKEIKKKANRKLNKKKWEHETAQKKMHTLSIVSAAIQSERGRAGDLVQ